MFDRRFVSRKEKEENAAEKLIETLDQSEAVVIGAGAGLSESAGFIYDGERFHEYFQDFIETYGFQNMYEGGFYPFGTLEEYWAYWSRYIYVNRYLDPPKPVYEKLYELVKDKDYFVLTTNVDHCFQKAGFDKNRLFYTQGDFGLWQCSGPCCQKTYDNEGTVRQMVKRQKNRKIPSELVPRCPVCQRPMNMNLRADHTFVEDEGWHQASERYSKFLEEHQNKHTLFWELGVGMNTPGIIKFSFWKMAYEWPDAVYACINLNEAYAPAQIEKKSICMNDDIGTVLSECFNRRQKGEGHESTGEKRVSD